MLANSRGFTKLYPRKPKSNLSMLKRGGWKREKSLKGKKRKPTFQDLSRPPAYPQPTQTPTQTNQKVSYWTPPAHTQTRKYNIK